MTRAHECRAGEASTSTRVIADAQAQDSGAWRLLFRSYRGMLLYWIRKSGVESIDVEDVAQEVLRAVVTGLGKFQKSEQNQSFRGWLRVITSSRVADYFRQQKKRVRTCGQLSAEALEQFPTPSDPSSVLITGSRQRDRRQMAIESIRGSFEPKTWRAFWEVTINERPVADVASELGVTSSAIRLAKSRVLRRLRAELETAEAESPAENPNPAIPN